MSNEKHRKQKTTVHFNTESTAEPQHIRREKTMFFCQAICIHPQPQAETLNRKKNWVGHDKILSVIAHSKQLLKLY